MRTNVQCLPEYQLDAAAVVVVVVVVVRRSWIGGKSNDPLVARSRATKKKGRGEEERQRTNFRLGFVWLVDLERDDESS